MFWLSTYIVLYAILIIYSDFFARKSLAYNEKTIPATEEKLPSISVIKPIKGASPYTKTDFLSWLEQDYPAPIEFIFSFQTSDDPALEILRSIQTNKKIKVLVHDIKEGFHGKTSNLYYGVEEAHNEVLIFSDGDIFAPPNLIKKLISQLKRHTLISCPAVHIGAKNLWAEMYATAWNSALFLMWAPSMLQDKALGIAGGTVCLRETDLEKLGGVSAFKDALAEDLEMGKLAKKAGLKLVLGPKVYSSVGKIYFHDLYNKFLRASLVALYGVPYGRIFSIPFYLFAFGYLFLFIAAMLLNSLLILSLASLLLILRTCSLSRLYLLTQGKLKIDLSFIISDALMLFTGVRCLFKRTVTWAGHTYNISKTGQIY